MQRSLRKFAVAAITLAMCATAAVCASTQATAPQPLPLRAELKPGEVLRYELEVSASFLPQADTPGAILNPPRGPCDYSLSAIVTLRPQPADKDGNTPVEATYSEGRVTSVRCAPLNEVWFQHRLNALQAAPVTFRVGPHGETAFLRGAAKYFDYWNGAELLRKVTRDLLQTEFSSQPVAPRATWKPHGQFAYGKDNGLHDLELSAAEMQFRNLVDVAGTSCAWITSKYVFSPLDLPASTTIRGGVVAPGPGNNAVAAVLEISLLLDRSSHHIAWLHRAQTIDNRLTLASPYDDPDDPPADDPSADPEDENPMPDLSGMRAENPSRYPYMTFHFQQDAKARLLPAQNSMEWLTALRRFEEAPEPETAPSAARTTVNPGPIAEAAKSAALQKTTRVAVDSDTLISTPAGFTRYEKGLCGDVWFCAAVSVGLPGEVQISEDTPLRSVYLVKKGDLIVSVALGPALDRQHPGLTDEEELKEATHYYLSNYVWLAVKPGIGTSFSGATLDGYPGLVTTFRATQRDLADLNGVLGMVLTPWGKVIPVSCESDGARSADLQALCEKIVTSVSVRR
jgi:hypothetical protein